MDRAHGRSTPAVEGGTTDGLRQASKEGDGTGDIDALLTFRKGTAKQQILNILRLYSGFCQQRLDRNYGEIIRAHLGKRALLGEMEWGTDITRNNRGLVGIGCHCVCSSKSRVLVILRLLGPGTVCCVRDGALSTTSGHAGHINHRFSPDGRQSVVRSHAVRRASAPDRPSAGRAAAAVPVRGHGRSASVRPDWHRRCRDQETL